MFDDKPLEELREKLRELREALDKSQMDRNQMQVDRDTVARFYDITKGEIRKFDLMVE